MNHPPYSEYKPSGVEWLGEIPAHWEVKRLRHCLDKAPARHSNDLPIDTPVSFVPMDAVGEYGGLRLDNELDLGEIGSGYTFFEDGDVVVAKITPCFENGKGALAVGLCNGVAYGTTELHVLRPGIGLERRFLFYLSISQPFRQIGEAMMYGAGGQKRVPEEFVKNFCSGLPPIDEQTTIADCLDRVTTRIDSLIAKKREFIDRLKEKRAALITQAVTRGLDPAVPMKDTGVAWLGEIPAHWNVGKLGYEVKMSGGLTPDKSNESYWDGNIPWASPKDMKNDRLRDTQDHVSLGALTNGGLQLYPIGRVLIVVRGMILLHSFPVAINDVPLAINQDMKALEPGSNLTSAYLFFYLKGLQRFILSQVEDSAHGTKALRTDLFKACAITLPPTHEQLTICMAITKGIGTINGLIKRCESATERLTEYRSALITAAVTGKIDVRNPQREAA